MDQAGFWYEDYHTRASISHYYWGDIKEKRVSGGRRTEAFFVKLHIIFAIKYNKKQLLLLLDKINRA